MRVCACLYKREWEKECERERDRGRVESRDRREKI